MARRPCGRQVQRVRLQPMHRIPPRFAEATLFEVPKAVELYEAHLRALMTQNAAAGHPTSELFDLDFGCRCNAGEPCHVDPLAEAGRNARVVWHEGWHDVRGERIGRSPVGEVDEVAAESDGY